MPLTSYPVPAELGYGGPAPGCAIPGPNTGAFGRACQPWEATVGCREWYTTEWPPSYKGVPFAVRTDSKTGGRRIHIHEYPSREWWDPEDMGRLRQQVEVDAFVFGDRCDEWSELLFAACTDAAVGKLYLPDRPPVDAQCLSVESTANEEKGVIHFVLRFILRTGDPLGLVPSKFKSSTYSKSQVSSVARNVATASSASFEQSFTGNQNQMARTQASNIMQRVVNQSRKAMAQSRIAPVESMQINFNLQRISALAVDITDLHKSVPDVLTPTVYTKTQKKPKIQQLPAEGFGSLLFTVMDMLVSGTANPLDLRQALIPMTTLNVQDIAIKTQATRDYSTNEELHLANEIATLTRRLALATSCVAIIKVTPEFLPDIFKIRDGLLARLDDEAFLAETDDAVYTGLRTLRSTVSDYVSNFAKGGKASKKFKFNSLMPLAVYAANIYPAEKGGKNRDSQLMKLNEIDHPMFPQTRTILAYVS